MNEYKIYLSRWFLIIPVGFFSFVSYLVLFVDKGDWPGALFLYCFWFIVFVGMSYVFLKMIYCYIIVKDDELIFKDIFSEKRCKVSDIVKITCSQLHAGDTVNYKLYVKRNNKIKKFYAFADLFKNHDRLLELFKSYDIEFVDSVW